MKYEDKTKEQFINELQALVTKHKLAEEELKEAKNHLDNIIESAVDSIIVTDNRGYITKVNKSFLKMLGYEKQEVIGKNTAELAMTKQGTYKTTTGEMLQINEDFLSNERATISKIIEGKEISCWESYYVSNDKKVIPIEVSIVALYNKKNERYGAVATIRNITERKKMERMLRENERFLDEVFESIQDGISVLASDLTICRVNGVMKKWYTENLPLEGKKCHECYRNKEVPCDPCPTVRCLRSGQTEREIVPGLLGSPIEWIELFSYPIKDITTGEVIGVVEFVRDITERKQFEEKLKEAKELAEASNRIKSDFLANMSHELRTPLNHIIGFTEIVVDKKFGELNETQVEYLNDVLHSSRHLLSLINDILDLSKMEAGKLELKPTDVNIKLVLENSLIMVKEKAIKNDIQLSTDIKEIPDTITADQRKLKQILYNLLSNAVKFTPVGGSILLKADLVDGSSLRSANDQEEPSEQTAPQKFIKASVADTGIGIRQEYLKYIFEPFKQIDSSLNRMYQGTGLGLSLAKKFVELHGGKIWVESEGEGKGCIFSFTIPA